MAERRTFDAAAFFAALDAERDAKKFTWKQVASEAEVSASTLTRIGQGRKPDVDTLAALSAWAGLDPKDFMKGKRGKNEPETLAMISTYLRGDPHLSDNSASALEEIIRVSYESLRSEDAPSKRVQERGK